MHGRIDRRRFIAISAAAAGMSVVPFGAPKKAAAGQLVEWRGTCLGAVATIRLHHPDKSAALPLIKQVAGEARRLEHVFSLYQSHSSLCELNRHGMLLAPPTELVALLTVCDDMWRRTGRVFDPTVQALWRCYAEHFARPGASPKGPSPEARQAALELVGWDNVHIHRDKIVFARKGMALTLNGIAQGYITDCVVDRLRASGIDSCLVDMGEIRALGPRPNDRPWQVPVENAQGEATLSLPLINNAVATSAARGFRFDVEGNCNHLFDPVTGGCAQRSRSITVVADTATMADALSTAFALMSDDAIRSSLAQMLHAKAYTAETGQLREISTEKRA